jgi:sialate O-acetylesterase
MNKITFYVTICILILSLKSVNANVSLPALFADNMVLQQNTKVNIWGWADKGEKISITGSWNNKKVTVKADKNGKWKIQIITSVAGGPYTLTIKGLNTVEIKNVMLGEVWVCSGQSNMHFPLGKFGDKKDWRTGIYNYQQEISEANYPNIRLFTVERKTSDTLQEKTTGSWDECSPATIVDFSAVAYFYGRELYKNLNVPIGLISDNYGGTPAEAWMKKEVLEKDSSFHPILERFKYTIDNFPRLNEEYKDTIKKWQKALKDSLLSPRQEKNPPRAPVGFGSNKTPCGLYNAMIAPIIPFSIKGVIWYQGENNADRAYQYRKLFPALISNWRNDWGEGNFPFYFVQIAPHRSQIPEIREAQLLTYQSVPNTGMAVTTDVGDSANIHPIKKQVVGYRLSLWALAKTYGKEGLVYSGPIYKAYFINGNKITLTFNSVGSGLECNGDSLTEFTICDKSKKFVPAHAIIEGNTVVVWADNITEPVAVRFAWQNIPNPNFYNKEGLPASPFRTDDWPETTFGKN